MERTRINSLPRNTPPSEEQQSRGADLAQPSHPSPSLAAELALAVPVPEKQPLSGHLSRAQRRKTPPITKRPRGLLVQEWRSGHKATVGKKNILVGTEGVELPSHKATANPPALGREVRSGLCGSLPIS